MAKATSRQSASTAPEKTPPSGRPAAEKSVTATAPPETPTARVWSGMRLALWIWAAGFALLLLQLLVDLLRGLWRWA
jgi:hypothetical protein